MKQSAEKGSIMKTIYIHKRCEVPAGLKYHGKLLWSSFTRYCFVCEKLLQSGKIYKLKSKSKGGDNVYEETE